MMGVMILQYVIMHVKSRNQTVTFATGCHSLALQFQ